MLCCCTPYLTAVMTEISRSDTTRVSTRQQQYLFRDRVLEMFSKRESKGKRHDGPNHLIAGTTAGVVTTAALYPLDLVKTRYQARTRGHLVSMLVLCTYQMGCASQVAVSLSRCFVLAAGWLLSS